MKKIEIIWRELLYQAQEKKNRRFTQKDLAARFNCSTSTVFQSLKMLRKMGAVRVTGRFFILEDPEKLLYHWASVRNLEKDILYKARVNLPILELEAQMPGSVVFGGFSAVRLKLNEVPADYDKVYVYTKDLGEIKKRFTLQKGSPNLIILNADPYLKDYGQTTTLAQTFADLWNVREWYAKEFVKALKQKIDEFLS